MSKQWFLPAIIALLLLLPPASADCKYFKGKGGFPLGIEPSVKNITASFLDTKQQNTSFKLYIEAELGTTTALDCRVELSIINESFALDVQLSNYTLETGVAFIERPIGVMLTPVNTINFPDTIETAIKIKDVDNPDNYAIVPIYVKYLFPRTKPQPSSRATATIVPDPTNKAGLPIISKKPDTFANNSILNSPILKFEDNNSKYTVAIIAFFFLGGLLWLGFSSMQRD